MKESEIQAEINVMERHLAARETEVRHIEEQIAVARNQLAEKPKLRHGDYGVYKDGLYGGVGNIVIRPKHGDLKMCHKNSMLGLDAKDEVCCGGGFITLGNIFDDLTALSKNMTEFKVEETQYTDGFTVRIGSQAIWMRDKMGAQVHVDKNNFSTFILNLQIMEATMKRQKGGGKTQ